MRQKHEALLKKRHAYRHKRYADSAPMRALQALLRRFGRCCLSTACNVVHCKYRRPSAKAFEGSAAVAQNSFAMRDALLHHAVLCCNMVCYTATLDRQRGRARAVGGRRE